MNLEYLDRIEKLRKYNPSEVEYHENGKIGWKSTNGTILIPAIYDQIELCERFLYIRSGNQYDLYGFFSSSVSADHNYNRGHFFVKNGKFGFKKKNDIIIPASYDSIKSYSDKLFAVIKDKTVFYINEKEEKVLNFIRYPEKSKHRRYPFEFKSDTNELFTARCYVGKKYNDSNIVLCGKNWVLLDQLTKEDVENIFISQNNAVSATEEELEKFNSESSYEFDAFVSVSTKGIPGCLEKIKKMSTFDSKFYFFVKVFKSQNQNIEQQELDELHSFLKNYQIGNIVYSFSHTKNIKKNETKLLIITFFNEE